ncbi:hypothetical protein B0J18DRAFT_447194 [Chaetomium sp. MPI-SDFR-AT-0129]|nr:hypothetical protein B0J18DRAFT_447194 [Chaetomium sp. MPI-SDFR-AT-0129]
MLFFIFCAAVHIFSLSAAECTRELLQDLTASYVAALAAGNGPSGISGLAGPDVSYIENDAPADIAAGLLSVGIQIDFNRSIYDTTQCASYTEIVATTDLAYVIGTRLALNTDKKIAEIRSNVCNSGDWLFNAKGSLEYNSKETWDSIPEGNRDTREMIQAAGDAYIDAWGDDTVKPPFASDCARLEGGSYISGGNCLLNFPPPFNITYRVYTIDEQLGAVDIFHNFPFLDTSIPRDPGTQTNNFLRIEGGKIKYIHENTVCSKDNCGR